MTGSDKRKYALFASAALNVFLVGAIGSHLWARSHHRDAEGRPHVGRFLAEHRGDMKESRRAMRDARRRVQEVLTAEQLDEAALRDALKELRGSSAAAQERMHGALVESASKLSVGEREDLARAMLRRPGRRGARR